MILKRLKRAVCFLAAGLFLFEAWLWDALYAGISWLLARLHIERVKAEIVRVVASLPASLSVAIFIVPVLCILPFKLLGVWLMAKHHVVLGVAVFLCAKLAGLGVTAFLFETCKDKLLTISWFFWLYGRMLALKVWSNRQIEPVRRMARALKRRLAGERLHLLALLRRLRRRVGRRR